MAVNEGGYRVPPDLGAQPLGTPKWLIRCHRVSDATTDAIFVHPKDLRWSRDERLWVRNAPTLMVAAGSVGTVYMRLQREDGRLVLYVTSKHARKIGQKMSWRNHVGSWFGRWVRVDDVRVESIEDAARARHSTVMEAM